MATAFLLAACGAPGVSIAPTLASSDQPTAGASATPALAGATFPPSQTPIDAGTYRWDGFERPVSLRLDAGWQLGHDNPAFFDLFRGSDFPAVSIARFTDVHTNRISRVAAVDAQQVEATFLGRSDMTMAGRAAIELGGLNGRQFDLTTLEARTPLFWGPAGIFQLDPDFVTRYRILDVPGGGVLVIGVHAHPDAFDAGLAIAEPVVASFMVEP
ncbi:MAG: hypothetical protein ABI573_07495 [Chloroflexota bacterium]